MLRDFQTEKKFGESYDCCVIGAGPAGITIALRLVAAGMKVVLLEGGGLEYSQRSQELYKCGSTGRNAYIESKRLRMLGGTSNHWAGRCRPFEPSDFALPPPNGMPGWPIPYAEIEPYLSEAKDILDLPKSDFPPRTASLPGGDFSADRYMFSAPTRFATKYAKELRDTPNLDVFVNCNCVDLVFNGVSKEIASVTAADYAGVQAPVRAKFFVLAMGAIENARSLLNSDSLATHGVITPHGLTGCCFMEHLLVDIGEFVLRNDDGSGVGQYYTTDAFVREHHVGKGNITFGLIKQVKSYGRTAAVKTFFKNLACSLGIEEKVQFIASFDCPGEGKITTQIEQLPQRSSRISLTNEKDALGMKVANLNWVIGKEDIHTIRSIATEAAKRFADSGLGYVKLNQALSGDPDGLYVHPHAHHMGTTRMAAQAADGVVDSNCKVFGVGNLYVAGSSIFARGGASNPTMPLIQFALRLVEHLKRTYR